MSVSSSNHSGEVQIVEALSLPEGDPVYEISIRGWGWQKETQQIRAGAAPASNETEVQVRACCELAVTFPYDHTL